MTEERNTAGTLARLFSRRWVLRGLVGGATGMVVTSGAVSIFAKDDDIDTPDTPEDDHASHGGSSDDVIITGEVPEGSLQIVIDDDDADAFNPGSLTVDLGQSITFVNADDDPHTATGSGFDTGIIAPGGTATIVLDTPGTFAYSCQIHPIMTGTVAVRDANGQVPPPAGGTPPAGATTVQIVNLTFQPSTISIPAGTTVSWTNDDAVPHTVTAVDGSFDSGIFDPGSDFSWEFTAPGTFAYVCNLHPQMQGTVEVTGEAVASADATPVAATPVAGGMVGTWRVALTPDAGAGLSPLQALVTYHDDGTLEATLSGVEGAESGLDVAIGPAQGAWTDDGAGVIQAVIVAFLLDTEERYAGTLTIREEVGVDSTATSYEGTFTFTAEDADGEELASGEGTSEGERETPGAADLAGLATPEASPAVAGAPLIVTIQDFSFDPAEIEIPSGATVTWVNEGQAPHSATASDGTFDTGILDPGQEASQIFDQPGEFPYFCAVHPDMKGTVVVGR